MRRLIALLAVLWSAAVICAAENPRIVFISGEYEYHSAETFPEFATRLAKEYEVRTTVLTRPADDKIQSIPGLDALTNADLAIIMIRRMVLPEDQLNKFKAYANSGKPLIGLRTASHSFENWKEFDHLVLGGNYHNHYGNSLKPAIHIIPEAAADPILRGFHGYVCDGSLYKNTPLQPGSHALLTGTIPGGITEPVAWTHQYKGARVFYSSLGHPHDFEQPSFDKLLHNAIEWALNEPLKRREGK